MKPSRVLVGGSVIVVLLGAGLATALALAPAPTVHFPSATAAGGPKPPPTSEPPSDGTSAPATPVTTGPRIEHDCGVLGTKLRATTELFTPDTTDTVQWVVCAGAVLDSGQPALEVIPLPSGSEQADTVPPDSADLVTYPGASSGLLTLCSVDDTELTLRLDSSLVTQIPAPATCGITFSLTTRTFGG